jgi:hypothetical protein
MKIRINQLHAGDIFEMCGYRWKVTDIKEGKIYFVQNRPDRPGWSRAKTTKESRGCKSNEFVNLIRRDDEKILVKTVRQEITCDGSGQDTVGDCR